ncbi:MAG: HD domain-containing protein [Desulfurococcaceae archaeon]
MDKGSKLSTEVYLPAVYIPMNFSAQEPQMFTPFNAQVKDPIYGYIDYIKGFEDRVMDSWVIQRLRYIYQLQAAHFIYPGATHSRFSHSLGVMHVSYRYISFMIKSSASSNLSVENKNILMNKQRELVFASRLLGLLHDIGHGPFSHAFDQYVYGKRDFLGYRVGNHEIIGYILYRDFVKDLLEKIIAENANTLGLDREYLLHLLDSGMKPSQSTREFTDLVSSGMLNDSDFYNPSEIHGFENIVRLTVRDYIYTSDIMDYLRRDSYFTGVPVGQINEEWIIRNSYILEKEDSRLGIAIAYKAIDEITRLFDARKIMYKNVYLHPVNRAFIETIGFLLPCIKTEIASIIDNVLRGSQGLDKYLYLTDHFIYSSLLRLLLAENPSSYECEDKALAKDALESLFIHRKPLWKQIKRFFFDLRTAPILFSSRFGESVQRDLKEKITKEISSSLSHRGLSENDVNIIIDKIDIYPSAGSEVFKTIDIADVKNGKVVHVTSTPLDIFAREQGLIPEALITIYINRDKYRKLNENDLARMIQIAEDIIKDAIHGHKYEIPETS